MNVRGVVVDKENRNGKLYYVDVDHINF